MVTKRDEAARRRDGAFLPSEVHLFGRVLERLGAKEFNEAQRRAMTQRVMALYVAGITDEDELVATSKLPLDR